ncbi:aminotransferase class I/II-fold pyridoxal phosphate-dependent enzyme [Streptomyces mobaraensis NBRC 13819 = DSM 40847]|uniref:cysteine-S-conjugate beta-lyase n=1 Tax=Streptomyces mobaraensis (strain ATCC 29032 / DSM 40847 / JCM 4168 / NBRC 13819 / NCIMB 11159 / IPCR 16-22) TaxID=1223523 RepID=M3B209_STRM1|nr:aminotransferase class I/II-fold pyridoxal phosphate-dependent enzyme [Streptomyces mobaraensis]EME99957.1 aminotransferase [Streptomyces mobaraensis NBRC 13819 = DSM 40847]QTT72202.1 aminotransferase class I/II-fold pyridoxal phosphate-dependent enzyme [Streptomyces mobaraensis NBRC 13819 = DSM 40847]
MFDDLDLSLPARRPGAKWSRAEPGVLPAWIAEMDFPPAPAVQEALIRCVHEELGYPSWDGHPEQIPLRGAFAERMRERHGWVLDPGHVREFTDINQGLQAVLRVATRPGDGVALHTPAYPPFLKTVTGMERRLHPVPYILQDEGWVFDAERLDRELADSGCRVLLLVNPHNPTGRVLRRQELETIAELALRHDLLVISDEIHSDLVHSPHRHIPFASLSPEAASRTVTLTSATKAFNVPGVRCAVAHIGAADVRAALSVPTHLYGEPNTFGVAATLAAWRDGDSWLSQLRPVLDRNAARVREGLPRGIGYRVPEAGFLAWLDCRALDLPTDPHTFFLEKARVLLNDGRTFGPDGEGFVRLNFGTSPDLLRDILGRMREAVG